MSELTEFLLARIAEHEGSAGRYVGTFLDGDMARLVRRVLAECEAKRAVVDIYMSAMDWSNNPDCDNPMAYQNMSCGAGDAVRALASAYREHPDYQQAWAL